MRINERKQSFIDQTLSIDYNMAQLDKLCNWPKRIEEKRKKEIGEKEDMREEKVERESS